MAKWCADLSVVTPCLYPTIHPVTLIYPYYESPQFLQRQIAHWRGYSKVATFGVSVIVVDDGSPVHPASDVLWSDGPLPMPIRLFRIERDVPWNWLAARNIGAHHAPDGRLLLTDMDHVIPEKTLMTATHGGLKPDVVYAFSRREHTGEAIHSHSASFLMTRAMFWQIGGYDERLSGVYGTDGQYRKRVLATAEIAVLADELVRYEYVVDSSVTAYERKTPAMRAARRDRLTSVAPHTAPKVLTFPYHEVAA